MSLSIPSIRACAPLASGGHALDLSAWGPLEWCVYGAMALACIYVLWLAVRMTVAPGEDDPHHVKRSIFDDDATPFGTGRTSDGRPSADSTPGGRSPPPRRPSSGSASPAVRA